MWKIKDKNFYPIRKCGFFLKKWFIRRRNCYSLAMKETLTMSLSSLSSRSSAIGAPRNVIYSTSPVLKESLPALGVNSFNDNLQSLARHAIKFLHVNRSNASTFGRVFSPQFQPSTVPQRDLDPSRGIAASQMFMTVFLCRAIQSLVAAKL